MINNNQQKLLDNQTENLHNPSMQTETKKDCPTLSISCDSKNHKEQKRILKKFADKKDRSVSWLVWDCLINGPSKELSRALRNVSNPR